MQIRLYITGRMYHLAESAPDSLELADGANVADAIEALQEQLGDPLPESTLVSLGGQHCGAIAQFENQPLRDGDELMFVAPVAGG